MARTALCPGRHAIAVAQRAALALYLFLHASSNNVQIRFDKLCERLGIPDYGGAVDSRALKKALTIVNAHLAAFTDEHCRDLLDAGIELVERWEIVPDDDGWVIGFKAFKVVRSDDIDDGGGGYEDAEDDGGAADADAPIKRRPIGRAITGGDVETDTDMETDEAPIERRHFGQALCDAKTDSEDDEDNDPKWEDYEY